MTWVTLSLQEIFEQKQTFELCVRPPDLSPDEVEARRKRIPEPTKWRSWSSSESACWWKVVCYRRFERECHIRNELLCALCRSGECLGWADPISSCKQESDQIWSLQGRTCCSPLSKWKNWGRGLLWVLLNRKEFCAKHAIKQDGRIRL